MADAGMRLIAQLAELGVEGRLETMPPRKGQQQRLLHLRRGSSAQTFELVEGPGVPLTPVVQRAKRPLFAHRPYLGTRTADAVRRAGVQYLDDEGNAWIEFGDVVIDVRGRPRPKGQAEQPRATGNLFSRGRAQVVLALLAWPRLWEAPQRELAHAAGVSLGQAHNTLALLAQAGHAAGRPRAGRAQLLDLWAAAFPTGLAERLTLATYQGEVGPLRYTRANAMAWISGEAAVPDLLRPAALTLYVAAPDTRLPVENRWRADGEPNIVVRRKFWNEPDSPHTEAIDAGVAPWPLVYVDLLASNNPRARKAAQDYRESHERAH